MNAAGGICPFNDAGVRDTSAAILSRHGSRPFRDISSVCSGARITLWARGTRRIARYVVRRWYIEVRSIGYNDNRIDRITNPELDRPPQLVPEYGRLSRHHQRRRGQTFSAITGPGPKALLAWQR